MIFSFSAVLGIALDCSCHLGVVPNCSWLFLFVPDIALCLFFAVLGCSALLWLNFVCY